MTQGNRIETQEGGRFLEIPLAYDKNDTVQYIARGGNVALRSQDFMTVAAYEWKYLTGHILRLFQDFQKNRGRAALINRVQQDTTNLKDSLISRLDRDLFSDGTGDGGRAINGLANLVADAPATGTVGRLNRATYSWWRNRSKNMTGENVSILLLNRMRTIFNTCGIIGAQGADRFPDIIVTTQTIHEAYEEEVQEIARVLISGNPKMADLGFGNLAFKGKPMTWDPFCGAGRMYFLNTKFLKIIYDPLEWLNLGEWLPIFDQPRDRVAHNMSVLNMGASNCQKQGVLYNVNP